MSIAQDLATEIPPNQNDVIADDQNRANPPETALEVEPDVVVEPEVLTEPEVDVEGNPVENNAFQPNFKFTSLDKEYEIDEFLRPSITDEDSQKRVKELYEKAYGIDHIKEKNTTLKARNEELEGYRTQHGELQKTINYYDGLLDKKDYKTFFKVAGIAKEDILKEALEIVKYNDLPPEEKIAYDNNVASQQRAYNYELENQQLRNHINATSVQARTTQLDTTLAGEQYQSAAQEFDTRMGRPGAFREAVINQGIMVENQTRNNPEGMRSLTPQEAADQVMQFAGLGLSNGNGTGNPLANPATTQTQHPSMQQKPVIPNVAAGHKSPAKKVIKSVAELRQLANQFDS